jgi:hypothetical protein
MYDDTGKLLHSLLSPTKYDYKRTRPERKNPLFALIPDT